MTLAISHMIRAAGQFTLAMGQMTLKIGQMILAIRQMTSNGSNIHSNGSNYSRTKSSSRPNYHSNGSSDTSNNQKAVNSVIATAAVQVMGCHVQRSVSVRLQRTVRLNVFRMISSKWLMSRTKMVRYKHRHLIKCVM